MPKSTKKDNKDIVDYIFDNMGSFKTQFVQLLKHFRDVWDVIPDLLTNLFSNLSNIAQKISLKTRAYMVDTVNNDITYTEMNKNIWLNMKNKYKMDKKGFSLYMKENKRSLNSREHNDIVDLVKYYVKTDKKDKFLTFCITQQNNYQFNDVRNRLLNINNKTKKINKTITNVKRKMKKDKKLDKLLSQLSQCSD